MSGFGGGFGSSQPPQQPTFGSQPNPSPSQFGVGFGAASPSGFASSPTAAPSFGGGGFGTAGSSPFVGSAATPAPNFGTSSNIAPFGSTNTGFGQAPSSFGAQNAPTPSFGGSTQNQNFPTVPVSQSFGGQSVAPQPFGGEPAAQPFADTSSSQPSFGGATQSAQPFGGASTVSTSPFQQAGSPTSAVASPFGNAPTSSSISFGVSANVVQSSAASSGFSNNATESSFGPTSSSAPSSFQTSSFGTSSATGTHGFGAGSGENEDMADSSNFNRMASSSQPAFGTPQQSSLSSQTQWGGQSRGSTMSPVPEQGVSIADSSMSPRLGTFSPPVPDAPPATKAAESEEEKLARLKAMIQAKKKKLEEQKKRKEAAAAEAASRITPTPVSTTLNPDAAAYTPTETSDLAERNKRRFGAPKAKSTQLPERVKENSENKTETGDEAGDDREDLENAVSLVGTCPYMCPDDELLRREKEGDIQLLEIPQPGTLHPADWSLRETAVKRFRRSAADFKLNVPEWVRPPDVLEMVCSYLEEWVMERDRQGPDPRFTQVESPPSLDVYQFIWDRTRMIRKDFILQNYVGTGGSCDARAVRCHERIARWHAMCEHQLSHIPDFVSMQSQQNIQELGQTMKTLNMYYDDSLGRSTAEVSDEEGGLSNASNVGRHGCRSDVVMGKSPVDFSGSPLDNNTASPNRLIGPSGVDQPSHGTAEPEMRGLYILLTMDNDGGLEVLKYAARLFRERPQVYHSKPVQLSLRIYKAKKDYNYARFFSIMRSPSTPYLFACIMFKYVQQMRRAAFKIMSKTYGAKRKDTGEVHYDAYPLKTLIRLLCFEDEDEALEVCKHYNAPAQKVESSSGKSAIFVRWRHSDYRERRDPDKGTVVSIKPRKMIRTIEAKLKGATRLAVCRGDVSGEGACLSASTAVSHAAGSVVSQTVRSTGSVSLSQNELERQRQEKEAARVTALQAERDREKRRQEEEAQSKVDQERKLKDEEQRREAERKRQEELEKKQAEEALRLELFRKKEREAEIARKKAEEEERKKRAAEEARIAAVAAAAERRRQERAEAERLAAEQEASRKREEEERRQLALRLKYEEEQRVLKLRQDEEERKRREAEARRLRQLEIQRQQEEEERKRKEEKERKIALEWERKITAARKMLFWRRWRRKVERRLEAERTQESLSQLDATYSTLSSVAKSFVEQVLVDSQDVESDAADVAPALGIRNSFYRLRLGHDTPLNLSILLRDITRNHVIGWHGLESEGETQHSTKLCKLAVVLPKSFGFEDENFYAMIHEWADSRLHYDKVMATRSTNDTFSPLVEFRTVAVNGNIADRCKGCNVALFIVPPRRDSSSHKERMSFDAATIACVADSTPKMLINLDDQSDTEYNTFVHHIWSEIAGDKGYDNDIVLLEETGDFASRLDKALESSCCALLESFWDAHVEHTPLLDLVTLPNLARKCICDAMWTTGYNHRSESGSHILSIARATLVSLISELSSAVKRYQNSHLSEWPPKEFGEKEKSGLVVKGFFGGGLDLPLKWIDFLRPETVEPIAMEMRALLNGSFRYVIDNMISRAPLQVRNECESMIDKKQLRRCLEKALMWRETSKLPSQLFRNEHYVYLPRGEVVTISDAVIECLGLDDSGSDVRVDYSSLRPYSGFNQPRGREVVSPVATMSDEAFVEETPALQSPFRDSKSSSDGAHENYRVDTTDIIPFEDGIGGADEERSPLRSAQEIARVVLEEHDFAYTGGSKRSLDYPASDNVSATFHSSKRRRQSESPLLSKDQQDSQDFTQRLEALLHGEATIDVDVGNVKLSDLLGGNVAEIELPK